MVLSVPNQALIENAMIEPMCTHVPAEFFIYLINMFGAHFLDINFLG